MRQLGLALLVGACGLVCQPVRSQWSSNAAVNLAIADATGNDSLTNVSARADGGCWIAWYHQNGSSYDLRLQLLDHYGYEVFPHNGILVSNHPHSAAVSLSACLLTDSAGNAVLAFVDMRAGWDSDVYAYRIDSSGSFLWGPDGVALSTDGIWELLPEVAEMTDGSFVFSWARGGFTTPARVVVQKLDASGAPQFGAAGLELGGPTDDFRVPHVVAAPGSGFILSWIATISSPSALRQCRTQKYDAAGAPLWGAGLIVADPASLDLGLTASMQSDGWGGAFFAWEVKAGSYIESRVQHVDASGAEIFPHNGVELSLQTSVSKVRPRMVQLGGDLIVFFLKWIAVPVPPPGSGSVNYAGVAAQRISASGTRLWGSPGIEYFPIDPTIEENPSALPAPNGGMCFLGQGGVWVPGRTIIGVRIDGNGSLLWAPSPMTACSSSTRKGAFSAIARPDGSTIVAFTDDRGNGDDVFAQNVGLDASLGIPPASASPYGCGVNEPGSLAVVSGAPSIGTTFSVGIDDPSGSMPPGSNPLLVVSASPDAAYPCGTVVPSASMSAPGLPGELLVDLGAQIVPMLAGAPWSGPGSPSAFTFGIPPAPTMVGYTAWMQGALLDPVSLRIGATNGLAIRIGP